MTTMEKLFESIKESYEHQTEYSDTIWMTCHLASLLDNLLTNHPELEQEYHDFADSLRVF